MAFPLGFSGSIVLEDGILSPDVLRRALILRGAEAVEQDEAEMGFEVGWLISSGPLWFIDRGRVTTSTVEGRRLTYTLSFRRSAATVALLSYGWLAGFGMRGESLSLRLGVGTFWVLLALWYLVSACPKALRALSATGCRRERRVARAS